MKAPATWKTKVNKSVKSTLKALGEKVNKSKINTLTKKVWRNMPKRCKVKVIKKYRGK